MSRNRRRLKPLPELPATVESAPGEVVFSIPVREPAPLLKATIPGYRFAAGDVVCINGEPYVVVASSGDEHLLSPSLRAGDY